MSRVVVSMSVSLDGYVAAPGDDLSWHLVDEELHTAFNEGLAVMGAFLHGRRMWELMSSFWPTADDDPDEPAPILEFARIWRDKPKVVYSTTLESAGWGATIARSVVPAEVEALKETYGDLSLGGPGIAAEFLRLGLVDEYRLYEHPVALGAGIPLFPPGVRVDLRPAGTRSFTNGVVMLRYLTA
jgi:dihydrofolate reductase